MDPDPNIVGILTLRQPARLKEQRDGIGITEPRHLRRNSTLQRQYHPSLKWRDGSITEGRLAQRGPWVKHLWSIYGIPMGDLQKVHSVGSHVPFVVLFSFLLRSRCCQG